MNGERVDSKLAAKDQEDQVSERGHEIVDIWVNGNKVEIHRGRQLVSQIKRLGDVPQADVLAEIIDGKLVDLPSDGSVTIKGGEVFYSHPQDSGSSQD